MGYQEFVHWTRGWVLAIAVLVGGCGGSREDQEESITPPSPTSAGIWSGSVTAPNANTSNSMFGIVDEDGNAVVILPSLTFVNGGVTSYTNTYRLDGRLCCGLNIDSTAIAVPPSPDLLDVPRPYRVTGQVSQSQFTGTALREGSTVPFQFNLTQQSELSARPLTLAMLAGTYSSTVRFITGTTEHNFLYTLNIDNTGFIVGNVMPGNCLLSGQATISNPIRNLFRISSFTVSGCSGSFIFDARRNGTHHGLGYLADDSRRPGTANNRLIMLLVMESQTGYWPITSIVK